jgi:peptidoglycan hydrolase CwlO-like protein
METNTEKPNQENAGVTVLQNNQSASNLPTWAKSLNTVSLTLIGILLALGINFGSIINKWLDNKVETQATELAQSGKMQQDSLSAVLEMNKTMSQQIIQLLNSVDSLVSENKRLTLTVEESNKTISNLQKNIQEIEALNQKYIAEISELKRQLKQP